VVIKDCCPTYIWNRITSVSILANLVVKYVIVINRRQGLYWFYKREARARIAPEAECLLNQYRPTVPVNKYFLDHVVT